MNTILDESLVGVMLLASLFYALSRLGPKAVRRRMLAVLAAWLARAPAALRLRAAAHRLERAAEDKAQGACGGCDNCESEPQASGSGTEISVPIANIARARSSRQESRMRVQS